MKNYELIYLDSVGSTNEYAIRMAEQVELSKEKKYVIVAEEQTAGKGRLGRSFESIKGKGIFASILVKPEKKAYEVANITLVAALAIVRALDELLPDAVNIKWPNDIILNGRKLCGILTEMRNVGNDVRCVVIGIGVNVNNESFSEDIRDKATSLYIEYKKLFDKDDLLKRIIGEFDALYERFSEEKDLSFIQNEYNQRLVHRNDKVIIEYKSEKQEAVQLGIDQNGMLKVMVDGEEKTITSGEILVRGVGGYV